VTPEEVATFGESVAGVAAKSRGRAADAAAADLADLWEAGAALGWFALGPENALDAALAAVRELGRVACPLPVMDGFVAGRLLGGQPGVPGGGAFEYGLRLSIMYVVGGGTNDIQRGLIARGLGLPR
jgi:hypothetical protein